VITVVGARLGDALAVKLSRGPLRNVELLMGAAELEPATSRV
jgi:hypothetical protein